MVSSHKRWLVLLVGAWAGCVGNIGDGPSEVITPEAQGAKLLPASTMHRLNRTEYRNTLRDLLGTQLDPAANFPADDISFGFDNIASVLSVSPLQIDLYETAAADLAIEALLVPSSSQLFHHEGETLTGDVGSATSNAWALVSNGEVGTLMQIEGGDYTIKARVWGQQAGPDPAQAAILAGGGTLQTFDVPNDANDPLIIQTNATLTAGAQTISVAFLNDYYMAPDDRNLYVDWIEVEGPLGQIASNPIREKIVFCDPSDPQCRRDVFANFGLRAWRRPLADDELDRLTALADVALGQGDSVDVALELGLRGILLSPHFIFRPELDEDPTSTVIHPLTDYELASRLSYFIWSSMPDRTLFDAAAAGELQDEARLRAEVDRMLADPKSDALLDNFAGQWLLIRALDDHVPDYNTFPSYDEALELAMKEETRLFFREFLTGQLGMDQLLSADFTYLNDRLATHYGIPFNGGSQHERVSLEGNEERFGLLTQGSLLTVTSFPNRTSPVKRGVWILEQLLCSGPPPPPPGVEGLIEETTPTGSLRERLEQHRADPTCAACHSLMDPLGLGLENYDGIGAYRAQDAGFPIDTTGEYFGETPFNGAKEMAQLIQTDPLFGECLIEKMFVYGLGRGMEPQDRQHIDVIAEKFAESGFMMPELIKLIVTSDPFRMRRGEEETTP